MCEKCENNSKERIMDLNKAAMEGMWTLVNHYMEKHDMCMAGTQMLMFDAIATLYMSNAFASEELDYALYAAKERLEYLAQEAPKYTVVINEEEATQH